ncbi:hypothetical protein J6TS1_21300 [Siminovitchia terrae]|uniref:Uncharacterized protein n=1 Tax=Siminovitchia terrae TaxID=1914933 RepID=A0ABQ4KWD0_SIMTE|nr:hypothetical protein J22TS1_49950 [Siminovitchia terrae]GIN96260.1 hypothetical protein J6TS1_21300 [Siminovitchia terrae]
MLMVGNVGVNRIRANCSDFVGLCTIPQMIYLPNTAFGISGRQEIVLLHGMISRWSADLNFIQRGFKPRLNKVKASGGYYRFLAEIYRAELDKIWA